MFTRKQVFSLHYVYTLKPHDFSLYLTCRRVSTSIVYIYSYLIKPTQNEFFLMKMTGVLGNLKGGLWLVVWKQFIRHQPHTHRMMILCPHF